MNNAGIIRRQDAVEFSEENWDDVLDTNLKTTFFLCQSFGRHLLAVEAAGVLLLVALVGSIAVVSRHGDPSGELAPARRAAS